MTFDGYDDKRRLGITLDNVTTDAPAATKFTMTFTDLIITSGGTTLPMPTTPGYTISIEKDVTPVSGGQPAPNACTDKFIP